MLVYNYLTAPSADACVYSVAVNYFLDGEYAPTYTAPESDEFTVTILPRVLTVNANCDKVYNAGVGGIPELEVIGVLN